MKTLLIRFSAIILLSSFAFNAHAAAMTGDWLVNTQWTLIHAGSGPADSGIGVNNLLRWDAGQTIDFDLTGDTLTASNQVFSLTSNNGNTATFTLTSMTLDLSGPNGFAGGSLSYELSVDSGPLQDDYIGTFTFPEATFGGTPFNSSGVDNGTFSVFFWGGDVANDIGIDVGISAQVVPIPAPLLLFGSALFGLAMTRRRNR